MKCKICGKVFVSQKRYNKHVSESKCPLKPCNVCGTTYKSDFDLQRHLKTKLHKKNAGLIEEETNPLAKDVNKLEKNLLEKTKEIEKLTSELQKIKDKMNHVEIVTTPPPSPTQVVNNITNNINITQIFLLNDCGVNNSGRIKNLVKSMSHSKNPDELWATITRALCRDNEPPIYRKPDTDFAICGDMEYELIEVIPEIKEGVIVRSEKAKESLIGLTKEDNDLYDGHVKSANNKFTEGMTSYESYLNKNYNDSTVIRNLLEEKRKKLQVILQKELAILETRRQGDAQKRLTTGEFLTTEPNDKLIADSIPLLEN